MATVQKVRVSITKSRAGHYTVAIRGADGRVKYIEDKIASLQAARNVADAQRKLMASASAMVVNGAEYTEAPETNACEGCACRTPSERLCAEAMDIAAATFGGRCGERNVIYVRSGQ